MRFSEVFKTKKPILAMIHLKGDTKEEVLERAKREIKAYEEGGVDGVIIENYHGTYYDMVRVLDYLKDHPTELIVGINCLNLDALGFELVRNYDFISFMQIDSVVGHLKKRDDASLEAFLKISRERTDVCLFGGVRFKYQPLVSTNTLEEDLDIAKERCDAICVTGEGTGIQTDLDKIKEFRGYLKDFPLVVAAGVTMDNVIEQLRYCDAAIVGSTFKDTRKDNGDVSYKHVKEFMEIVKKERG